MPTRSCAVIVLFVLLVAPAGRARARADAPFAYAVTDARIVTATGDTIPGGTVLIRDGLVEAVGAVDLPAGVQRIDGRGLTVYPGLIDMGTTTAVEVPAVSQPRETRTLADLERWKRSAVLRPQIEAARHVRVDAPELPRIAAAGITTVLAVPPGEVVSGRSALVSAVAPDDPPQVGAPAGPRHGAMVVRTPVALHVEFTPRPRGNAYPNSLMGVIAFVRQAWHDARYYGTATAQYNRAPESVARPAYDPALEALQPALEGTLPVAFAADSLREIRRALAMAGEFGLDPIITGGREAGEAGAELKAAGARVIFSLNYPARPRWLAPEADEPVRILRERARAPQTPAALHRAGVPFAFQSGGLKDPKEFVRNAARAVEEGLPADAAVRALTIGAARIAGVADRLGSIEPGKIANLIVTDGDLFAETTSIRHVFVDGRLVTIEPAGAPPRNERARPGATR